MQAQLGARTNWEERDELAMLFQGTYTTAFYRQLRDALHDEVRDGADESRWFDLGEAAAAHRLAQPVGIAEAEDVAMPDAAALSPALEAFDAVAARFDARFGEWRSVAAQRRAVRRALAEAFPRGARVLEIGGGTGEDARWLAARGRVVQLTDGSPAMVRIAQGKLRSQGGPAPHVVAAEALDRWAAERESAGEALFDGAFSNFAALNCVGDLDATAHAGWRGCSGPARPRCSSSSARSVQAKWSCSSRGATHAPRSGDARAARCRARLGGQDVRRALPLGGRARRRDGALVPTCGVASASACSCRRARRSRGSRGIRRSCARSSRWTACWRVRSRRSAITCCTGSSGRMRRATSSAGRAPRMDT